VTRDRVFLNAKGMQNGFMIVQDFLFL